MDSWTGVYIPDSLPPSIPQVLINREPLKHLSFDVELLGDCDVIVQELCHRLGDDWTAICSAPCSSQQILRDDMSTPSFSDNDNHPPTPPNSEDNSRMSFQVASEEDSRMSFCTNQDGRDFPMSAEKPDSRENSQNIQDPTSFSCQGAVLTARESASNSLPHHRPDFQGEDILTSLSEDPDLAETTLVGDPDPKIPGAIDIPRQTGSVRDTSTTLSGVAQSLESPGHSLGNCIQAPLDHPNQCHEAQTDHKVLRDWWKPKLFNLASKLKGRH